MQPARAAFEAEGISELNNVRSHRYLGGVFGDAAEKEEWVREKVRRGCIA